MSWSQHALFKFLQARVIPPNSLPVEFPRTSGRSIFRVLPGGQSNPKLSHNRAGIATPPRARGMDISVSSANTTMHWARITLAMGYIDSGLN